MGADGSLAGPVAAQARLPRVARWVVCYSDRPSPAELAGYDLVVLDADRHPALAPLTARGQTVLAYVALVELGRDRRVFPALKDAGVILDQHPVWTDAHYVDIRRPEWTQAVTSDLVAQAIDAGFSGIFLDTLDDADFLESKDPERYRGMRQAAVALVKALRERYPRIVLMVNRGYALMPEIAGSIDVLLGESVRASFNSTTKAYTRVSAADLQWQVDALRRAKTFNPALQVLTLDYWQPSDREGLRRLYREQRAGGFVPYVATPSLDVVIPEPR